MQPGAISTRSTSIQRRSTPASGAGRCLTDDDERYSFVTVKPGAYPGATTPTRGAGASTSRSSGAFPNRLVTQMYFPGIPLFEFDPIFQSVRDPDARTARVQLRLRDSQARVGARLRFDVVLGGPAETTWRADARDDAVSDSRPILHARALRVAGGQLVEARTSAGAVRVTGRVLDGAGDPVPDAMVELWQADEGGRYRATSAQGRSGCDADGRFSFMTVKPGRVGGADAAWC